MKARRSRSLSTDDEAALFLLLPPERRRPIIDAALELVARSVVQAHRSGTVGELVGAMVGHRHWSQLRHLSPQRVLGAKDPPEAGRAAGPPPSVIERRPRSASERVQTRSVEPRDVAPMPTSTRKTSASDFIRSMPPDLRPSEVVARGAARGLRFSENLVYKARGRAKAPEARPDGGRGTAPVARPSKPDLSEMLVEYIAERPGRRLDELYTHFGGDRLLLRATLDALSAAKKLRTIGRGRNTTYMVQGAQAATRRTPSASRPAVKAPRARVTRSVAVEPAAGEIAPRTVDATSVEPPVGPLAVDDGPAAEPAGAAVPAPVIAETIEGEDLDAAVNALGQLLGEAAPQALQDLRVVVRRFGLDLARAAYQKTVEIEAGEGMVRDGRRKTPGGVFFYLAKTRAGREQLGPGFADLRPIRVDPPTPVPAAPRETASPPSASSVELMNAMVMFIAKNPGLREEQIRSRLAGDRRLVRATLDALRTQKRVKMVGSGRAAVFVVPD